MIRKLALFAAALALFVVVLGSYVRLSDAGLGCPDWPGCYGQITPHHAAEDIAQAHAVDPHGPVSAPKAWKEMVHRYFAGGLGLLVFALTFLAWSGEDAGERRLTGALAGLIVFQALLGMWTVTLLLKPVVVTGHLLGGLATLSLLLWLGLRRGMGMGLRRGTGVGSRLQAAVLVALLLVALQIFLGGWVSSNYAALACPDFPTCRSAWLPDADFGQGFSFARELGQAVDGGVLSMEALTAIHLAHRVGAVLVLGYLLWLVARLWPLTKAGAGLLLTLALVLVQVGLGIGNVLLGLPLPVAVAHNAGAALLLSSLVVVYVRLPEVRS